jgi:hypothetical protein
MNSNTCNPTAAGMMAHQTIQDRVQDAERRAQVHMVRAERRTARREARASGATPPANHRLQWRAFRFPHPAR